MKSSELLVESTVLTPVNIYFSLLFLIQDRNTSSVLVLSLLENLYNQKALPTYNVCIVYIMRVCIHVCLRVCIHVCFRI